MPVNTLEYILRKYTIRDTRMLPVEIPDVGRNDLATLFAELGFHTGAEIGVETGLYSEVLCKANPKLKLCCVDAWTAYKGYRDHVSQSKLDGFYDDARKRLAGYHCEFVRKFSVDAAQDFEDGSLDFCYIDANHEFVHVVNDIAVWSPKVRSGGIVAGHDYIRRKNPSYRMHVMEAVHGYTRSYHTAPWFVLGSKAQQEGATRDRPRSWMWVKA